MDLVFIIGSPCSCHSVRFQFKKKSHVEIIWSRKMSQLKEKSESVQQIFVRGSKARRPFRIRQSYNNKLPLSAVVYIKSLEQNAMLRCGSIRCKPVTLLAPQEIIQETVESSEEDFEEIHDPMDRDDGPLLPEITSSKSRCTSKSLPPKRQISKIVNFFRKKPKLSFKWYQKWHFYI